MFLVKNMEILVFLAENLEPFSIVQCIMKQRCCARDDRRDACQCARGRTAAVEVAAMIQ